MISSPRRKQIRKLVKPYRLKISTYISGYQWTGVDHTLRASSCGGLLHELAHYQIASPKQRKKPDFGLGRSPDSKIGDYDSFLTFEQRDEEEQGASLLGIAYEVQLGLRFRSTLKDHNWLTENPFEKNTFFATIKRLQTQGFLDLKGRPTHFIRDWEDDIP